jgi:hypothetical protein
MTTVEPFRSVPRGLVVDDWWRVGAFPFLDGVAFAFLGGWFHCRRRTMTSLESNRTGVRTPTERHHAGLHRPAALALTSRLASPPNHDRLGGDPG